MTYLKIWIHFVFSTKNREALLNAELRPQLVKFLRDMTREQKVYLDHLAVLGEHMHCLVSLGRNKCHLKVMKGLN